MSRKFMLSNNWYDENGFLYKKETITINPGVTVLVGCNGIGKTTLLHQISAELRKEKIPYIEFDNLHDGGEHAISEAGFYEEFDLMSTAIYSSEGENIVMNMSQFATRLGHFVRTGEDPKEERNSQLIKTILKINGNKVENDKISNERWILLDAIDSGLSVDNVIDIKELLFKTILENNFGKDVYIIVSANEYEMARDSRCFDVYNGKYIEFVDYEEYRQFILDSKKNKEERDKMDYEKN